MSYVILSVTNFLYIFLKAFQQRNVAFLHYGWAALTNFLLVLTEVVIIGNIASVFIGGDLYSIMYSVLALGIGGGSGCIMSMYIHSKYLTRRA